MLEYNKIDVSEGIDINKTNDWHECRVYHYWYFLKINFTYQALVCRWGYHDLQQKSMGFDDVGVITVRKNY